MGYASLTKWAAYQLLGNGPMLCSVRTRVPVGATIEDEFDTEEDATKWVTEWNTAIRSDLPNA